MAHHNETGARGEIMARVYLEEKGFVILHQNWRHSHWEVDIIASKGEKLHFIEVKTRRSRTFGFPEDSVSKKKLTNLIEAAEEFTTLSPKWKHLQFDILSIILIKNTPPEFLYIEDIYI